jgi:hypothetical protein
MERYPISGLLKSHTPSARQRITNWMNQNMFGDTRQGQGKAERLMGVMDYTPLGAGTAMYDAGHDVASGNMLGAGMNLAITGIPPLRKIKNALGHEIPIPRTFYRGQEPGRDERISTGNQEWDSHLFAADSPESAMPYGSQITQYEAAPDANILYEGTKEFTRVAGKWRKGESLLDYSSRAAAAARAAGFDAVWFKRQGDVGTAIINPQKFTKK